MMSRSLIHARSIFLKNKTLIQAGVVIFGVNLTLRFWQRNLLYAPGIDESFFVYWAQSVARAPSWGVLSAIGAPLSLIRHPESKLYQLLALVYLTPLRIFNIGSVLLLSLWLGLFGSGLIMAQICTNFLGVIAALCLGKIAFDVAPPDAPGKDWLFLLVSALAAFNPILLRYSAAPSYHGITMALLLIAAALAGPDWKYEQWGKRRAILIWVILLGALYGVHLIPAIFVFAWSICDISTSVRKKTLVRRTMAYWLSLAAVYLPGAIFIALFHAKESARWASIWSVFTPKFILPALLHWLYASGFCLPFLILLPKNSLRKALPILCFCFFCAFVFIFIMNSPNLSRIFLYQSPIIALGGAGLWCRPWGRRGLTIFASLFILISSLSPGRVLKAMFTEGYSTAVLAYPYEISKVILNKKGNDSARVLLFENHTEAACVLARLSAPPQSVMLNAERYVQAIEERNEGAYLKLYYPNFKSAPGSFILLTRGLSQALRSRIEKNFRIEELGMASAVHPVTAEKIRWEEIGLRRYR